MSDSEEDYSDDQSENDNEAEEANEIAMTSHNNCRKEASSSYSAAKHAKIIRHSGQEGADEHNEDGEEDDEAVEENEFDGEILAHDWEGGLCSAGGYLAAVAADKANRPASTRWRDVATGVSSFSTTSLVIPIPHLPPSPILPLPSSISYLAFPFLHLLFCLCLTLRCVFPFFFLCSCAPSPSPSSMYYP